MNLREFVRDALVQICDGVSDAQRKVAGAVINPKLKKLPFNKDKPDDRYALEPENLKNANMLATNYADGHADIFEFDVALTVSSSQKSGSEVSGEGKVEGKIYVASANVDLQGKKSRESESSRSDVSRIKFRVPVQFRTG